MAIAGRFWAGCLITAFTLLSLVRPTDWGLRDYGIEPVVWGGDSACDHTWGEEMPLRATSSWDSFDDYRTDGTRRGGQGKMNAGKDGSHGAFCRHCNAWLGSLGLEPTPDLFVEHIVEVFRGVRRVLRPDGVCWVNLGDSYISHASSPSGRDDPQLPAVWATREDSHRTTKAPGLKPKDLCGVPWRVAFALQADGWYWRSCLPWLKRSAMPESCQDRPTTAIEYFFLFTKSVQYFFDMDAVRMQAAPATLERDKYSRVLENDGPQSVRHDHETTVNPAGRSFRNSDLFYQSLDAPFGMIASEEGPLALDVTPESFPEAHFATFGQKLIEPLILAGTSEHGCCPKCGAPWERLVERETLREHAPTREMSKTPLNVVRAGWRKGGPASETTGWRPTCKQDCRQINSDGYYGQPEPVPCTVLDPFAGSGTVGQVAKRLNRNAILIEAKEEYCEMARARVGREHPVLF